MTPLRIGYFAHWFQPPYKFVDFLAEQGISVTKIDYSKPGYLEPFDVALVEQNGFNDYIENDELYIQDWVKRGGILLFMHQDYQRWAPYFLPKEVGYPLLVHRYVPTINGFECAADPSFTNDPTPYMSYLMPWIEDCGKRLFSTPEVITPDEMLYWKLDVNSFGLIRFVEKHAPSETVRTSALSCFIPPENWDVLGSFMDPSLRDGALILRAKYGKGMYFLNQILFPEVLTGEEDRCLAFWKKYIKNLLSYLLAFKQGQEEILPPQPAKKLPKKKNYKLAIHMHSLDWYGAEAHPGTINAMMRYMGFDICSLAVKDNAPYDGKLDTAKYSDDKVLFLDGQEYHPFNWNDKYDHLSHNTYHMLAMGIDPDCYTQEYTRSFFSDAEIAAYTKEAIDYVHAHGGAVCATHPNVDFWRDYSFDAVDKEPMRPLSGTDIEAHWLSGKRIALMDSVDLFGPRRVLDNPAVNFLYLGEEEPCRDSVVAAIKAGHTIAACGFDEADICLGSYLPGDEVPAVEAANLAMSIKATVMRDEIRKIRVYSADQVIYQKEGNLGGSIDLEVALKGLPLEKFLRVEIEGQNEHWICNSSPFYLK